MKLQIAENAFIKKFYIINKNNKLQHKLGSKTEIASISGESKETSYTSQVLCLYKRVLILCVEVIILSPGV